MKEFHITVPETVVVMQKLTVKAESKEEAAEKLENYNVLHKDIQWWDSESHEVIDRHTDELEVTKVNNLD